MLPLEPTNSPLLAITPGEVIGFIVFIVTILSWLAQAFGGKKANPAVPRQKMGNPVRPPQNLQDGIELFKKLVAEQQQQQRGQQPQPGDRRPTPPPISAPRAESASGKNKPKQEQSRKQKKSQSRPPEQRREGLGSEISQRHIAVEADLPRHVIAEAQRHLAQNSVGDQVRNDLKDQVSAQVKTHLGTDSTRSSAGVSQRNTSSSLRALLKNKNSMAQAIVINEILQPPVALRKK